MKLSSVVTAVAAGAVVVVAGTGAGSAGVPGATLHGSAAPSTAGGAGAVAACAAPSRGAAACFAQFRSLAQASALGVPGSSGRAAAGATGPSSGYGPADIASIYRLDPNQTGQPSQSSTPTTTRMPRRTWPCTARPGGCRPAPPPTGASRRSTSVAGVTLHRRSGLGCRDRPRPGLGLGGLPAVPHPARRGRQREPGRPRPGRRPRGPHGREGRVELLRHAGVQRCGRLRVEVLQPPGRRDGGLVGRQRLRAGQLPGRRSARDRSRRHDGHPARAAAGRSTRGAARAAVARPGSPSRHGRPTRTARVASSPTSPRWLTPTPAFRSTTPTSFRRCSACRTAGSSSAVRAWPHR